MKAMKRVAPLGQMKVRKIESDNNGHGGQVDTKVMEKNRRSMGEEPKGKRGKVAIKYRECRRNYAASIGRHANDGCREFMPGGTEGTREAVWCGACGCHQNFHRKEQSGGGAAAYGPPPPPPPTYLYNAVGSIPSSSARREKNPVGGGFPPPLPPRSLPQQPLPPLPAPTAAPAPAPAPAPAFCCQQEQSDKHKYERRSKKMEVEAGKRKNKRVRTNP